MRRHILLRLLDSFQTGLGWEFSVAGDPFGEEMALGMGEEMVEDLGELELASFCVSTVVCTHPQKLLCPRRAPFACLRAC